MDKQQIARQLKKAYAELEDCGVCLGDAESYFVSAKNRVEEIVKEADKWIQGTESSTA